MDFIGSQDVSIARFYLGFFVVSFVILAAILVAGVPAVFRGIIKAFHLIRARRTRNLRMLAELSSLESASDRLEGVTLFVDFEEESSDYEDDDENATRFMSDVA